MSDASSIARVSGIAARDLRETLRDRRTLFITLLLPMLMYPIVAVSSAIGVRTAIRDRDELRAPAPMSVVVSGDDAPAFAGRVERLRASGEPAGWPSELQIEVGSPKWAKASLEAGGADLWLDLPEGLLAALDRTGSARLTVTLPSNRPTPNAIREQFGAIVDSVARAARIEALAKADLPEAVLDPVGIAFVDLHGKPTEAVRQLGSATIVGAILMLLSVLTLTGGYYPAVDAIAGEKERGTIETLLIAPCRPWEFATGKYLAVLVVTLLTLLSNIVSIGLTVAVTQKLLPSNLTLVPRQSAAGVAIALLSFVVIAAVGTALCLAVTTWSRSTKEAQHSLTPVIIVVSLLSAFAIGSSATASSLLAAVPFAGQIVVAKEALFIGQSERPAAAAVALLGPLLVTAASAAGVVAILLRATAGFLVDEEVLFRGPDAADGVFSRPAFRLLPTAAQGLVPAAVALASLWYAQAIVPDDLLLAIPLQQTASLLVPLAVIAWWQRVDLRRTLRLALPATGWRLASVVLGAVLVGIGLFVVGSAAVLMVVGDEPSGELKALAMRIMALVMERPWWLSWIVVAVVPAVCEEFVYRGWVLSGLAGERPEGLRRVAAVVAQGALFAVVHLLPERMPTTFLLGVVLGWMAMATGSILPGIVCHVAHNTVPIVLVHLAGDTASPDAGAAAWPLWVPAAGAVAAIVGAVLLVVKRPSAGDRGS